MAKIKSIKFKNHKILGNLELNFCDNDGEPVDTVIIAGENGTGKTTILEEIYNVFECKIDKQDIEIEFSKHTMKKLHIKNNLANYTNNTFEYQNKTLNDLKSIMMTFRSIYSTVNINFNITETIHLFGEKKQEDFTTDRADIQNSKSDSNIATQIANLLVAVRNDDAERTLQVVEKRGDPYNVKLGLDRFRNAFNTFFDNSIKFKGIEKINNKNKIIFEKNGKQIFIDNLSSGEKQIVFRGAFLLRDKEILYGAIVLIDEPEISMHPEWQKKIMDFYKTIFQDEKGNQTSQIIAVTHSPFIIHNENRYNDKVIVLKKIDNEIKVLDKPEFYQVNNIQVAVEDAFNIKGFLNNNQGNIVFVEGKTDEQYFNKAIEIFGLTDLPFKFQAIGGEGETGGYKKLDKAYESLVYMNIKLGNYKFIFLYDCDCYNKDKNNENNENKTGLYIKVVLDRRNNEFNRGIEKGIENLLILSDDRLNELDGFKNFDDEKNGFYNYKLIDKKIGKPQKIIDDINKNKLCRYICGLDDVEKIKIILSNLKEEIEKLKKFFEK